MIATRFLDEPNASRPDLLIRATTPLIPLDERYHLAFMRRPISSDATFIFKFIVPVGYTLFISAWSLLIDLFNMGREKWVFICFIAILSVGVGRLCLRIKKVAIEGEYIYVSNYVKEIRVSLAGINKVSQSYLATPKLVHLAFKDPILFGKKISFIPQANSILSPYKSHPVVDELLEMKAMNERGRGDQL